MMRGIFRAVRRPGDRGATLAELIVSLAAGSVVIAAATAIFVPAMQSAARDRQAGLNLAAANTASTVLQRQVRDATYVQMSAYSSSNGQTMTICTYPTASSQGRSVVVWKYTKAAGLTMQVGSSSTPTGFGDRYTFDKAVFGQPEPTSSKKLVKGDVLDMRFVTGDRADGTTSGTIGTTLQFSAAVRQPQITSTSSCS